MSLQIKNTATQCTGIAFIKKNPNLFSTNTVKQHFMANFLLRVLPHCSSIFILEFSFFY